LSVSYWWVVSTSKPHCLGKFGLAGMGNTVGIDEIWRG
jgi:hypothetical protein